MRIIHVSRLQVVQIATDRSALGVVHLCRVDEAELDVDVAVHERLVRLRDPRADLRLGAAGAAPGVLDLLRVHDEDVDLDDLIRGLRVLLHRTGIVPLFVDVSLGLVRRLLMNRKCRVIHLRDLVDVVGHVLDPVGLIGGVDGAAEDPVHDHEHGPAVLVLLEPPDPGHDAPRNLLRPVEDGGVRDVLEQLELEPLLDLRVGRLRGHDGVGQERQVRADVAVARRDLRIDRKLSHPRGRDEELRRAGAGIGLVLLAGGLRVRGRHRHPRGGGHHRDHHHQREQCSDTPGHGPARRLHGAPHSEPSLPSHRVTRSRDQACV